MAADRCDRPPKACRQTHMPIARTAHSARAAEKTAWAHMESVLSSRRGLDRIALCESRRAAGHGRGSVRRWDWPFSSINTIALALSSWSSCLTPFQALTVS